MLSKCNILLICNRKQKKKQNEKKKKKHSQHYPRSIKVTRFFKEKKWPMKDREKETQYVCVFFLF
jgi:hypothetical protein